MYIEVECDECGRVSKILAEAVLRNGNCMYCGGSLSLDDEAREVVEGVVQEYIDSEEKSKRTGKVLCQCPICDRSIRIAARNIGDAHNCMYCGCLFEVPEEGFEPIPGPPGAMLVEEIPPNAHEFIDDIDKQLSLDTIFHGNSLAQLTDPALLGLEALRWRIIRGHASIEEALVLSEALAHATVRSAPEGVDWNCPLAPADAAELIAGVILDGMETSVFHQDDGDSRVLVTTDSHVEVDYTQGHASAAAAGGLTGVLFSLAAQKALTTVGAEVEGSYRIRHYLKVICELAEEGTIFHFSHEYSSGEEHEITDKQKEIIDRILNELYERGSWFIANRCVFGEWISGSSMLSINTDAAGKWLSKLDSHLSERVYSLVY